MEKAYRLTAEKNLDKGNDFSILDAHSDSHLSLVVKDSCLVFSPSAGTPSEALSLVRAKEKVQAALAEHSHRQQLAEDSRAEADATSAAQAGDGEGSPSRAENDTELDTRVVGPDALPREATHASSYRKLARSCARSMLTVRKGQGKHISNK
jgi:hypothetical protein